MWVDGQDLQVTAEHGLPAAAAWISAAMTGSVATIIATLAIAGLGLAMLQGRLAVRQALRAILGCFILFGSPYMARELMAEPSSEYNSAPTTTAEIPPPPPIPEPPKADSDPYAGASLPQH